MKQGRQPRWLFPPGDDRVMGYYHAVLIGGAVLAVLVISLFGEAQPSDPAPSPTQQTAQPAK